MRLSHKFAVLLSVVVITSSLVQFVVSDKLFLTHTATWMLSINNNTADNLGQLLSMHFKKIEYSLRTIASDPKIRNNQELLDEIREIGPEIDTILILNKQGNIVLDSGEQRIPSVNLLQRDYFKHAIKGETYISNVYTSALGNQIVSIALPIIENGTIDGVIVGIIQLHANNLATIFDNKSLGRDGFIAIDDAQGIVVYHADKGRIGKEDDLFDKLQGLTGSLIAKNYYGVESYIGYSSVPEYNWLVIVSTPTSEIFTLRNMMFYQNLAVSILLIFLIIAIGTYTIRRVTKPIEKLMEAFNLLKNGKFEKISSGDYAVEFGQMVKVYNDTVIALKAVNTDLKGAADLDVLTGAYNRRSFDKVIELLCGEMKVGSLKTLGVMMLDLDFFKQLNDKQGHLYGDDVLKKFTIIMQLTTGIRTVFRFGGDEFAILVRNISSEETLALAEDIRLQCEKELTSCTVSIGIVTYPKTVDSIEKLIDLADKALYLSKKSKNKITEYI